jgi:hypothetical protein
LDIEEVVTINSRIAMPGRRNAAEFKSILLKILPCGFDEVFPCVPSKYRMSGFASIWRFPKGRH